MYNENSNRHQSRQQITVKELQTGDTLPLKPLVGQTPNIAHQQIKPHSQTCKALCVKNSEISITLNSPVNKNHEEDW